ncbi:hypothetical protein CROQUDRAFT_659477 [Cronartium quercuum f. sp. fusiforme G11]|uniref:Uncharacterized protein n=1 Tax=Cronartium quercuum f. sp. fusiforme G11 TaxID=708437 RepID=A0A9P6TA44_9BASI|nr:hypothetical protein CROQUDRAFT_659477 [Cronartium quercuum f. sp. fusiforme G11]
MADTQFWWSETNGRRAAIEQFEHTHQCNCSCKALSLPPMPVYPVNLGPCPIGLRPLVGSAPNAGTQV